MNQAMKNAGNTTRKNTTGLTQTLGYTRQKIVKVVG
jgi:hypothetical protein